MSNPHVIGGEPVFRDTRLSVRHIGALAELAALDEIRADYPDLSAQDIAYALVFLRTMCPSK